MTADALSAFNAVEKRYDDKRGLKKGRRLGCQATIQGDVVIDVPPESQVHKQVVRKRAEAREIVLSPAVRLCYVEVQEPDMHEPTGDFERLAAALESQWQLAGAKAGLPVMQALQPALRKGDWAVTCAVASSARKPPRRACCTSGRASTPARFWALRSIWARPPLRGISAILRPARLSPRPA